MLPRLDSQRLEEIQPQGLEHWKSLGEGLQLKGDKWDLFCVTLAMPDCRDLL